MPGVITVVNKKTHKPCKYDIYIGRPSPLGNVYSHMHIPNAIHVATRDVAVSAYKEWLWKRIEEGNNPAIQELGKLIKLYKSREILHLVCWCAPLACHGDIVKTVVQDLANG